MGEVKLILGTMTFGPQVDQDESLVMMNTFADAGHNEFDTAFVYNNGDTERILGKVLDRVGCDSVSVATKVHPRITGKLDARAVEDQFLESLNRMNREKADILYFHFPDPDTPIEGPLEKCAELHGKGLFKELGLSNYPAWMVVDIWHLCRKEGWPVPTVYQGMYNGLARNVEPELFPALRRLGMRFYAFNPLAGGMLTGKHLDFKERPREGRFSRLKSYRDRYWKEDYFASVSRIRKGCDDHGIPMAEAAFRWLVHHSLLEAEAGDGIIMGASSREQLESNISSAQKGPLPEALVGEIDKAWYGVKENSPPYFRFLTQL